MTLFSLSLGLYRVAFILLPIGTILYTSTNTSDALTLFFLWFFSYWRGMGQDTIQHTFGLEAHLWVTTFAVLRTIPLIQYTPLTNVYLWLTVLALQASFEIASRIPRLRKYIVEPVTESQTKTKNENHMSWKHLVALVVVTSVYNITRVVLLSTFNTLENSIPSVSIPQTGSTPTNVVLFYPSTTITYSMDYIGLYTQVVETVVAILFVIRLPSLSRRQTNDFWNTGGGVYLLYLYVQTCILAPVIIGYASIGPMQIASFVGLPLMFATIVVVEGQVVSHRVGSVLSVSDDIGALIPSLKRGVIKIIHVVQTEPVLLTLYLIFSSVIAFALNQEWYTTIVQFTGIIPELSCPALFFIDNQLQFLYTMTSTDAFQSFFLPVLSDIGVIRSKVFRLMEVIYPVVITACDGATSVFVPTTNVVSLVFVLSIFLPTLCIVLMSFVEMELVVRRPSFWLLCTGVNVLALFVTQLASDTSATIYYFFMDTNLIRDYTSTGLVVVVVQILLVLISFRMYLWKQSHHRQHGVSGRFTKSVAALPALLYSIVTSPGALMLVASASVLVYAILFGGSPFSDVNLLKRDVNNLPSWLILTDGDKFAGVASSIVSMFGKKALILLEVFHVVSYLLNAFGNVEIPIPHAICQSPSPIPCSIDLDFGFIFSPLLNKMISLIESGFDSAASFFVNQFIRYAPSIGGLDIGYIVGQIDSAMATLPSLDFLDDFDLFNISGQFPSFRIPSWVPILFYVLVALVIVCAIAILFFEGAEAVSHLSLTILLSFILGFLLVLMRVKGFLDSISYSVSITFSSTVYLYLASIALAIAGGLMIGFGADVTMKQAKTAAKYTPLPTTEMAVKKSHQLVVNLDRKQQFEYLIRSTRQF